MAVIKVGNPKKTYFIVDSESLAHIGYYAFTAGEYPLVTTGGLLKGTFHGFFQMLKNQVERHSPEDMYFCWGDNRENLLRKKLFSGYKAHRDSAERPGLNEQIVDIKYALALMGYSQYFCAGYEGDDIIASVVKDLLIKKQKEDCKIIILSNDKDMAQLVDYKVVVCTPSQTNYVEYTVGKVIARFGVPPEWLADYLCLVGDSSDNVPGVTGIGPKTAAQLLNDNGCIAGWFNNIENIAAKPYVKHLLKNNRTNMVLSKKLVSLNQYSAPLNRLSFSFKDTVLPDHIFNKYEMTTIKPYDFLEL